MNVVHRFMAEHRRLTRRFFLGLNAAGAAAITLPPIARAEDSSEALAKAIAALTFKVNGAKITSAVSKRSSRAALLTRRKAPSNSRCNRNRS